MVKTKGKKQQKKKQQLEKKVKEVNDDEYEDMDAEDVNEQPASKQVYLPGDPLEEDEELVREESAYEMFHEAQTGKYVRAAHGRVTSERSRLQEIRA